jgi:hypothetical protein
MRIYLSWSLCLIAGCGFLWTTQPYIGTLPADTQLDMSGEFAFSQKGELVLTLARPCTMQARIGSPLTTRTVGCSMSRLKQINIVAHTPWGQDIVGNWKDALHIVFAPDWKSSELDALVDDLDLGSRPWMVSGAQWSPAAEDAKVMANLVRETALPGAEPSLEVTKFEIQGGQLHAGAASTIVLEINNRGSGVAHGVVATTRSSIQALHGQHVSFGSIKQGETKVRSLKLTVPASEAGPDTMLVLVLSEKNGFAPSNVNRRVAIEASTEAPDLGLHCAVIGQDVPLPELDAGRGLALKCVVANTGNAEARQASVEAWIEGGMVARSPVQRVPAASHTIFDLEFTVPREFAIGASVEISITALEGRSLRSKPTIIRGVVRKPKLCVSGQLTLEQYNMKLIDLRTALKGGDLTQAQLDRYDAELVACLK